MVTLRMQAVLTRTTAGSILQAGSFCLAAYSCCSHKSKTSTPFGKVTTPAPLTLTATSGVSSALASCIFGEGAA